MRGKLTAADRHRIADYLDGVADEIYSTHYDPKVDRPTPRSARLEIAKVRRWIAKLRAPQHTPGQTP
jgi:hypothetical protein